LIIVLAHHLCPLGTLQATILFIPFWTLDYGAMSATLGSAALGFVLWPLLQVSAQFWEVLQTSLESLLPGLAGRSEGQTWTSWGINQATYWQSNVRWMLSHAAPSQ
jgi:hypothetical protein